MMILQVWGKVPCWIMTSNKLMTLNVDHSLTWLPPCPWQGNKPSLPLPSLTPIESKQYPLDGFRIYEKNNIVINRWSISTEIEAIPTREGDFELRRKPHSYKYGRFDWVHGRNKRKVLFSKCSEGYQTRNLSSQQFKSHNCFYSYKIITIQILHSTTLPLITVLHYEYDTMRSERQWLPHGQYIKTHNIKQR